MELATALESEKFTIRELTAAINNVTVPRTRLAELKLFEEKGISTTSVQIEYKDGQIQLVQDVPRGDDGEPLEDPKRKLITFNALHLVVPASIFADEIQNSRAFGEEDEFESLQDVIDEKAEIIRQSFDITIEYFRFGAIFGKIYNKKGEVVLDLFKVFEIKETDGEDEIDFNLDLPTQLLNVKRHSEKNIKGPKPKAHRAFCRPEFFDEMLKNESFYKAFDRYNNGEALREDVRRGVSWQGVFWEEYDEKFGDKDPMPAKYGAVVVPEGKAGLFLTRFAPGTYSETVNTKGLPYYMRSEPKRFNKGVDLEGQSSPINLCTNPLSVRRIKFTPKTEAAA